jgi:hypothetical protein
VKNVESFLEKYGGSIRHHRVLLSGTWSWVWSVLPFSTAECFPSGITQHTWMGFRVPGVLGLLSVIWSQNI